MISSNTAKSLKVTVLRRVSIKCFGKFPVALDGEAGGSGWKGEKVEGSGNKLCRTVSY